MKRIFFALLTGLALQTGATAQTNTTNTDANTGGHMNNRTTTPADERVAPALRDGNRTVPVRTDGGTMATERVDVSATIGGMSRTDFDRMNAEGSKKVAAITPTATPLSKSDQKLLVQMAEGGIMQLQVSQAAEGRVQREDVKVLARSEVEEQTGVTAKIMEIAKAKGMVLNTEPTAATTQMLQRIEQTTDLPELYEFYLRQSGINGHEKLMKTGEKVMREAGDPALKALAKATAPVIKMHMQVSQGVLDNVKK